MCYVMQQAIFGRHTFSKKTHRSKTRCRDLKNPDLWNAHKAPDSGGKVDFSLIFVFPILQIIEIVIIIITVFVLFNC